MKSECIGLESGRDAINLGVLICEDRGHIARYTLIWDL